MRSTACSSGPGRAGPSVDGGGRPRLISDGHIDMIIAAATGRPEALGLPFTHWSVRKRAARLASRGIRVGRERLRRLLHARGIS